MAQPLKKNRSFSEKDIERLTNSIMFHLKESLLNPFTMSKELKESPLMEGVFSTYEPEKVKRYLEKRYGKYAFVETFENDNNVTIFRIGVYNDEENKHVVDSDMALCGYFPSETKVSKDGTTLYIYYEPRHQNKVNELVQDEEYIYHLTHTNKVNKILKNGLVPKTNNKKFLYPDRIYCFLHEPDVDDCLILMKQFYNEELKKAKQKNITVYNGTYTLLKIDTELVKNIDFSYDPNAIDCVYTYDNIPPQAITIERVIEQEYIKNKF